MRERPKPDTPGDGFSGDAPAGVTDVTEETLRRLVAGAAGGDAACLAEIHRLYGGRIRATIRRRMRTLHGYAREAAARPLEWLLLEEREHGENVLRAGLSNVEESASLENMVRLAKTRWRVERDYQEMKDELGLDHYEGRGWRGFHHHATLCIAAYAFLAAERARLSPLKPSASSGRLAYRRTSAHGELPESAERHDPWCIATQIARLVRVLAAAAPCCTLCGRLGPLS